MLFAFGSALVLQTACLTLAASEAIFHSGLSGSPIGVLYVSYELVHHPMQRLADARADRSSPPRNEELAYLPATVFSPRSPDGGEFIRWE